MMKSLTYLFYFLLFCVTIVSSTTFFVSPTGSDVTGDGSNQNPWASWSHSSISLRPLLPTMTENFNVVFLKGRYFITETVVLGLQDSGQNGYSVIYSSA